MAVVVQGTAVNDPYVSTAQPASNLTPAVTYGGATEVSSEQQPRKTGCNDPLFALLFYIDVAAIFAVAFIYAGDVLADVGGANFNDATGYETYVFAAMIFGGVSFVLSFAGLFMLLTCPAFMIKAGLIFSVLLLIAFTAWGFLSGVLVVGIIGAVFLLLTLCYIRYVWPRIPFAAVNMETGATAIKANLGVTIFAVFFTLLSTGWLILWSISVAGVYEQTVNCDENGVCSPNYAVLFGLFLALFFVQQVLLSCVHVTVAGTVGTWWVAPEESGCCSKGVCNSFIRTITTSFGSICFGSLLVAILQALRAIANTARNSDDCAIVACIFECILGCLQSLVEYFNKWAFIYVGVYGDTYVQSGKSVMQLFRNRGWEAIIADDLVGGAIGLTVFMLSLAVGGIGVAYARLDDSFAQLAGSSDLIAFVIGLIAGLVIISVLLGTISSAVNTVIVMFADSPREFASNHPELSAKMTQLWGQFYPGSTN